MNRKHLPSEIINIKEEQDEDEGALEESRGQRDVFTVQLAPTRCSVNTDKR